MDTRNTRAVSQLIDHLAADRLLDGRRVVIGVAGESGSGLDFEHRLIVPQADRAHWRIDRAFHLQRGVHHGS